MAMEHFGRGGLNSQVDPDELLESIGLDDKEITWRKNHIDFGDDDAARLADLEDLFIEHQNDVADRFYENLTQSDSTLAVFNRSPKDIEALKKTQRAYLVTLANGEYGEDYFKNRARIGKLHEILDMPLHFYIGQYGVYYNLVFEVLDDRVQQRVVEAIREWTAEELQERDSAGVGERLLGAFSGSDDDSAAELAESLESTVKDEIHAGLEDLLAVLRIVNLDMQVAVDTYVDAYASKLQEETERRERLAREVKQDVQSPLADVNEAADQVAQSTQDITALADEGSDGAMDIADEIADVSAATEEIASTASEVHGQSQEAKEKAEAGKKAAREALATMHEVDEAATDAADDVAGLAILLDEFDDTLDVVDDIARRTKHLGRQATLESTQVGQNREKLRELADEVKSFADETDEELDAIREQVEEMRRPVESTVDSMETAIDEVDEGTDQVESSMAKLDDIADAVRDAADGVEDVAAATDTQAESIEQIAAAANQTATTAKAVASETDGIAAATEEQKAQVEQIARNIHRLTDEA